MQLYENIKDNLKESYGSERSISAYLEEQIPHNMRYKICKTISSDDARKKTLYWVTQDFFTEEDLNKFVEALKNIAYDDAYITVRDLSVYDFNTDLKNDVLIHIKNGANGFVEGFDKYWEEGKNYFDEEPMNESESTGIENLGKLSQQKVRQLDWKDGNIAVFDTRNLSTDDVIEMARLIKKADKIFKFNDFICLYSNQVNALGGRHFTDFQRTIRYYK